MAAMSLFSNKLVSRASHVLKQFAAAPTLTTTVRTHSSKGHSPDDGREKPYITMSQTTFAGSGPIYPADLSETDDAVHLRVEVPGLAKEEVKVTAQKNALVVKAGATRDTAGTCRFEGKLDLSEKHFRMRETEAELKDGVLHVMVPKVKDEPSLG